MGGITPIGACGGLRSLHPAHFAIDGAVVRPSGLWLIGLIEAPKQDGGGADEAGDGVKVGFEMVARSECCARGAATRFETGLDAGLGPEYSECLRTS